MGISNQPRGKASDMFHIFHQIPSNNLFRLRLFAIIPLVLSLITARRLLDLPRQTHTTSSSTLTLAWHLLISNLFLLALPPAILVLMLVASISFVTLIFRLLLVGYFMKTSQATKFEWHVNLGRIGRSLLRDVFGFGAGWLREACLGCPVRALLALGISRSKHFLPSDLI